MTESSLPTKSAAVLVVDDEPHARELLCELLSSHGVRTMEATDGQSALELVWATPPDLVLLDIEMPKVNGFEVVRRLKADPKTATIPVIMITGMNDRASRLRALEEGADDYLSKPIDASEMWVRVRNHLRLKEYSDFLTNVNQTLEKRVSERTAKLHASHREAIYLLTSASEYRDEDTGAHVRRIGAFSSLLARRLGMSDEFVDSMFYASPMHDIGKIGIPDRILLKPGPLTPEERRTMQTHTEIGAKILKSGDAPYIRLGAEIALTHHECWDGGGYPAGLSGEAIPLSGRIVMICDQYDALRSTRPYKPALDHATVLRILTEGDERTRPSQFSPDVLRVFVECSAEVERVFAEHTSLPQFKES